MVSTYFEKKTYFVTGFAKAVCLMIIIGLVNYNYSLCISFVSECTLKLSNRVLNATLQLLCYWNVLRTLLIETKAPTQPYLLDLQLCPSRQICQGSDDTKLVRVTDLRKGPLRMVEPYMTLLGLPRD